MTERKRQPSTLPRAFSIINSPLSIPLAPSFSILNSPFSIFSILRLLPSFQRSERFLEERDAPAQFFLRRQFGLSDRVVKFAAGEDPADADLLRDVGETGDQYDGDSFLLDFLADRSAATSAGSSSGGQYDRVDAGGRQLVGDAGAELGHLARHGAGAGGDEIIIVEFFDPLRLLQRAHGVERNDAIGILIDRGGVVTGMHRGEFTRA